MTQPLTVLSIVGTRPEAIKMAPVLRELQERKEFRCVLCATAQHRQMLDQVLDLYALKPDFDLDLMKPNQQLGELTAAVFAGLDPVITEVAPDWILAQGDTTTTMVASLAAYYHHISFGHVEAGLRTDDKFQPFPEEVNRRVADVVADILFAPTERARNQLLKEGYPADRISVTGNTIVDALQELQARDYAWGSGPLAQVPQGGPIVLVTAHRRESFGPEFRNLCQAIRELALAFASEKVSIVYPVHMNPNVRAPANEILQGVDNIYLLEPVDYLSLVNLIKKAVLILTDSGGIQEEAPSFGVPVLVMRKKTERPEGIEAGVAKLVGTDRAKIVEEASALLKSPERRLAMTAKKNPYGDGKAAVRIADELLRRR